MNNRLFLVISPRYVKSQPIPENNDGPVQVVVGKTFEKEVTNSDVDVFIKVSITSITM